MFDCPDRTELRRQLNQFQIPLFAAERREPDRPFRFLCVNEAHEMASGITNPQIADRTPHDILPPDQADEVSRRYSACADSGRELSYSEVLVIAGRRQMWQTTLQPIETSVPITRILGNALCLGGVERKPVGRAVDEELRTTAVEASFHLSRVLSWLEAVESRQVPQEDLSATAMAVSGLCRAVESSLSNLRALAEGGRPGRPGLGNGPDYASEIFDERLIAVDSADAMASLALKKRMH